jgi:hypothetical protein
MNQTRDVSLLMMGSSSPFGVFVSLSIRAYV